TPAAVVPGISFSPDKMLQARLFSYGDAQRYRLGVNHHQIPVNAPQCPFQSFHRDGAMRTDGNLGGTTSYQPNSYNEWNGQEAYKDPALPLEGDADIYDFREDDSDYYTQPGKLFNLMSDEQKEALFGNTARNMDGATDLVKYRHIRHCFKADQAYGQGVAKAMNLTVEDAFEAEANDPIQY